MFERIHAKKRYIVSKDGASKVLHTEEAFTCSNCHEFLNGLADYEQYKICPFCRHHFYLTTKERIEQIADEHSFLEYYADFESVDPLSFPEYKEKLRSDNQKSGLKEAVSVGLAKVNQQNCVLAIMDKGFRMGSMGVVVGEKITKSIELALEKQLPYIIFTASGGARMQEGVLSLMQMAKTVEAMDRLKQARLLSVVVITNPTTGGVAASFVNAADIILAEPAATYSFAGKKVIEQTIHEQLPSDFQLSEFSLKSGHIDRIVDRAKLKDEISLILQIHGK